MGFVSWITVLPEDAGRMLIVSGGYNSAIDKTFTCRKLDEIEGKKYSSWYSSLAFTKGEIVTIRTGLWWL